MTICGEWEEEVEGVCRGENDEGPVVEMTSGRSAAGIVLQYRTVVASHRQAAEYSGTTTSCDPCSGLGMVSTIRSESLHVASVFPEHPRPSLVCSRDQGPDSC